MMDGLISILRNGNHSLVVSCDGIRTFDGRGVSDLYRLFGNERIFIKGAKIADRVVGKAAAALMVLLEAGEVYAEVISQPALDLLADADIRTTYGVLVPHIVNRSGTGLCPLETRCLACSTPQECLQEITAFIKEMNVAK